MAVAIAWLPGPAGTRRRVAKPSVEEPDAAEPARPDLWGGGVSNDPGLPDPSTPSTPTTTLRPAYATTAQSRLTRPKAATRRLSLDYIIERPTLGWLQTENEKVPYRTYSEWKQVQKRFFTMKFPVAVDAKAATFAYVDPGLTTEPHSRAAHEPSARRAGSRGFTAGFQAADLVTAGFNLRTRAALHTRARATESNSHRGRCFGRRRRSDTD